MSDTMAFFISRVKNIDPTEYIGEVNRIFYYPDSGTLRISDGVTPGGQPINLLGNVSNIAIGNFVFSNTTMTTSTANADLVIDANGTGNINLISGNQLNVVGAFHVHADGNLNGIPNFDITSTGETTILNPTNNSTPGLSIIGNDAGTQVAPGYNGVMLQLTGQATRAAVNLTDGVGNRASITGRRYNGTSASPTQVLNGEIVVRFGADAYTDAGFPNVDSAYIDFIAAGNQTSSNYGTTMEFWTTPENHTTPLRAAYFSDGTFFANNITSSGNVVIKATGNASNIGILQVTNNSTGNIRYPVLANVIAQFTGKDDKTPFIVFDGYGNTGQATGGTFVFRTARGNLATPAAVQNNDPLGIVNAAGWGTTGYGGVAAAAIEFQAAGTFSDTSRPGKIVLKAIPSLSTTPTTVATITPTSTVWADGLVMSNAWITLPSGTSTQAPLTFTASATLNANPSPGSINFDGSVFYGVPTDSERGIMPMQQQFVLDAARNLTAGTTAAQSLWGSTVNLSANTRYYYEINAYVVKSGSGANQPTINYGIATVAGSLFSHFYTVNSSVSSTVSAVNSGSQMFNYITTGFATGVPVTAAMPVSVGYARVLIKGYIDVNTAATVDFQIAFSAAPNTSCSVQPKSGILIYPVGPAATNTSTGTWNAS